MKTIPVSRRFANSEGDGLVEGKIHMIRANYDYWKRFEGKDVALFYWEGKPFRSRQYVFCVKRIMSIQEVYMQKGYNGEKIEFLLETPFGTDEILDTGELWKNDGFRERESFEDYFAKYHGGDMEILHFTNFRYG
jgi:hypothetical protein